LLLLFSVFACCIAGQRQLRAIRWHSVGGALLQPSPKCQSSNRRCHRGRVHESQPRDSMTSDAGIDQLNS
jgi:hypothetical protein